MTWQYEFYLCAAKANGAYFQEMQYMRNRFREMRAERDELAKAMKMAKIPAGWTITICPCGFTVTTLPDGKHFCPKCN